MILNNEQLDEIRKRNAKRVDDEWIVARDTNSDSILVISDFDELQICRDVRNQDHADFIAHSPDDITNLLETVDALKPFTGLPFAEDVDLSSPLDASQI